MPRAVRRTHHPIAHLLNEVDAQALVNVDEALHKKYGMDKSTRRSVGLSQLLGTGSGSDPRSSSDKSTEQSVGRSKGSYLRGSGAEPRHRAVWLAKPGSWGTGPERQRAERHNKARPNALTSAGLHDDAVGNVFYVDLEGLHALLELVVLAAQLLHLLRACAVLLLLLLLLRWWERVPRDCT